MRNPREETHLLGEGSLRAHGIRNVGPDDRVVDGDILEVSGESVVDAIFLVNLSDVLACTLHMRNPFCGSDVYHVGEEAGHTLRRTRLSASVQLGERG